MRRKRLARTLRTLLAGALGALAIGGAARAQQVYWDDPGSLGAGQRTTLDLIFADTEPAGRVTPPRVDGFTVVGPPSQTSSVQIINGKRSASVTLSFPVRAEREGSLTIPSFEVETTAGTERVDALRIEVGAATLPGSTRGAAAKVSDVVDARLTPANMTPYAGEVFDVDFTVGLVGGRSGQVVGTPSWDKPGVMAEPWGDGKQVSTQHGSGVRFHTRALAPQAGRIEIAPAEQEVQIQTGAAGNAFDSLRDAFGSHPSFGGPDLFDSLFARAQTASATVKSNAIQVDVRPLPEPAPAGFTGAVGQFELTTSLAPQQPKTGEPITWTLTLKGNGNWPGAVALPARAVPNDFRALQPKQHKDFAEGELFSGTLSEDLVLIPNQPGDVQLEPLRFVYFDPAKGKYQAIEARPPALHVTGAPIAAEPKHAPAPAAASLAPARDLATTTTSSPPETRLPHDPLRGVGSGLTPTGMRPLAIAASVPVVLLFLYWLALEIRHARLTDPRRPQREAFKRLAPAIDRVRAAATPGERIAALLAWQRTAAIALGVDLAAPTTAQFRDPRWIDVWAGSERALYGREHALSSAWCECARALCTRTKRIGFNPLRAFPLRRMIPKAATAALLIGVAAGAAHAVDPLDGYARGDFAGARDQLLARAKDAPSDWIARYDLGLAESQLGSSARALGETLSAFVHAPANADVRWNAHGFAAQVPGIDPPTAALIEAPGLAAVLSPAAWQLLVITGALIACSGAALWLRSRYRVTAGRTRLAGALLIVGPVLGVAALLSLHAYGPLADPRAALVAEQTVLRSVPTDAERAQQQKALAAGTLVVVEQDFLGWVKVGLRGGETGWVRHGDVVPLYAAPSA